MATVIRRGRASDAAFVLALFDEAVAWLAARGQPGQWGTTPWSERPSAVGHVQRWSEGPGLRIAANADGMPVGALALGTHPPHVEPIDEPERYVEALVTSRRHAGHGIGAALVAAAADEAREGGAAVLRVDCWAGAPPLVAWYERQGFERCGTFDVDGWIGQVFAMRL
ncbi:MAG: GNAT family N-acetyltransferase [Solirubrobacteraceae bacterium]